MNLTAAEHAELIELAVDDNEALAVLLDHWNELGMPEDRVRRMHAEILLRRASIRFCEIPYTLVNAATRLDGQLARVRAIDRKGLPEFLGYRLGITTAALMATTRVQKLVTNGTAYQLEVVFSFGRANAGIGQCGLTFTNWTSIIEDGKVVGSGSVPVWSTRRDIFDLPRVEDKRASQIYQTQVRARVNSVNRDVHPNALLRDLALLPMASCCRPGILADETEDILEGGMSIIPDFMK